MIKISQKGWKIQMLGEGVATRGCAAVQAGAVRLIDNVGGYGPYDK